MIRHYSRRTEEAYVGWIRRFILSHNKRNPPAMGAGEVNAFLTNLAVSENVASSTRAQALSALLYGAGLRLLETLRLRVKDLDFPARILTVREGKRAKDRRTIPPILIEPLRDHLGAVRALHCRDLTAGHGEVWLPHALARKYPSARKGWAWQYVFPAPRLSVDPRGGVMRRHHLDESGIQKAVRTAVRAKVDKLEMVTTSERSRSCSVMPT